MRLIIKYIKQHKLLFLLNLFAILAFSFTELGIPTIMAGMINEGISTQNIELIQSQGLILFLIAIVGGLGSILMSYTSSRIASYITRDIRRDLFRKSQEFSHSEYNEFGVSSMITRVSNDVYQLQLFTQLLLRMGLNSPIMIFMSMTIILRTNVTLALVMSISVPFILLIVYMIGKTSGPLSAKQQGLMDTLNRIIRENITGVRVIRAFRKDKDESKRFALSNEAYAKVSKQLFRVMSRAEPLFFFILNCSSLLIAWFASGMIQSGSLEVGTLVAFFEYQFQALFSLLMFSVVFIMYPRAAVSARRIEEMLYKEPLIKNPENGVKETVGVKPSVVFENVSFAYPDSEAKVLNNINLKASAGETIAFIGSTGSGKSTLINLIVRFYDVTSGRVLVDGVDVKDYDLFALRDKVGFIPQKALLFSGSISDNIRYGKRDAKDEEVIESANLASASDFIAQKEDQYEALLSEGGSNVSGGQKQRLSIARALVRRPEIYIFDDSFSALDYKTDALIRRNLKTITKDSITFVVAQRISSIVEADKIVVMNEGEIVAQGTHLELMKSSPIYLEIAQSQLSEKEMAQYENI